MLLTLFVAIERRVSEPLLPLRIVVDRNRAGAYIAVFTGVIATFGMFLFLTYYLQDTLHYSPVGTGVAYLPMIVALVGSAQIATNVLLPRFGPKVMVATGMVIAAVAMLLLTRIGLHSNYVTVILPALVILGLGMGQIMAPSASVATVGLTSDAGIASAMVNTSQQVGGSVGTSLLNTLAASAATTYALANRATATSVATLQAQATVHGYRVVFAYAAVFLVAGAVIAGLLLRSGAVASLEITGERDKSGNTDLDSSGRLSAHRTPESSTTSSSLKLNDNTEGEIPCPNAQSHALTHPRLPLQEASAWAIPPSRSFNPRRLNRAIPSSCCRMTASTSNCVAKSAGHIPTLASRP